MKVKIKDEIYDADEVPIMLILSEKDKFNIAHMTPEADRYAAFPENLGWDRKRREDWMDEGYEPD